MKRIVSIWLPSWPIFRLKRAEPDAVPVRQPFALIESGAHGLQISALNDAAARLGLEVGTALSDARAAHPALMSRPAEPRKDKSALLKLARWAGRYGPNRHIDGEDGFWIDVTGAAHLFGGEENLLDDITQRLASFGVPARTGLADTFGAAHALARFGCPPDACWAMAPPGQTREAIEILPVEALRLEASRVLLLKRLGLRRIGQLYAIPRDSLQRRFRSADIMADVLMRLDQALGSAEEPCRPMLPPPVLSVARVFADPLISSEALENCASELASELVEELAAKDLGARTVRLAFYRADGTAGTATATMSMPCRKASHMMRLLKEKLAGIDAGFGIDLLRLDAMRVGARDATQEGFSAPASEPLCNPAALVDRLVNRFGSNAITILEPRASHIPERAERRLPALEALAAMSPSRFLEAPSSAFPKSAMRPAFMLRRPEPIDVIAEVPDGPPAQFIWRRVEHRVARAEGPERIAPEWWNALYRDDGRKPPRTRDYYRIEDHQGAIYWVFRHGLFAGEEGNGRPSWFLHGLFA
jgi:protein ImuB